MINYMFNKVLVIFIMCVSLFACAPTKYVEYNSIPPNIINDQSTEIITPQTFYKKKVDIQDQLSIAFKNSEWTANEKRAFILSIIGHTLDLISSLKSDERCVERNPILGTNPSDGALIGMKLLAIGFEYWLYNNHSFRSQPTHYYGYTSALIHGYAGISNFKNDCY